MMARVRLIESNITSLQEKISKQVKKRNHTRKS